MKIAVKIVVRISKRPATVCKNAEGQTRTDRSFPTNDRNFSLTRSICSWENHTNQPNYIKAH